MKDWQLTFSENQPWPLPGRAIMIEELNRGTAEIMAEEKESFWELLASLQKKLFNFLHKALNFSEDSKDLYQEVVIRAWRYFPSFDRRRSFSSWIFAIAHNEIKKHFNKHKEDQKVIPLALLAVEPAAPSAEDPAVALIYGAARQLPLRQREIFFLFYYNNFSIAEIAVISGLRQGNVKFILNRGREAVRQVLEATHEK
jgi:RNA polymerase sigma-70 factor (ECF subfamily)